MNYRAKLLLLFTVLLAMASSSLALAAPPPLPASFYGRVTLNGADVPAGTPLSAWVAGVKVAEAPTLLADGDSVYRIDVPGDDPATPAIEGGQEGEAMIFQIAGVQADQTATWSLGSLTSLDLTATAPPSPPVAFNQAVTTDEDSTKAITLTAFDPNSDALTFKVVAPPNHGSLSGTPPVVTYSPEADYHGTDSFTFQANDGTFDSNIATVSITIRPINNDPPAADAGGPYQASEGTAFTLDASGSSDPDGNILSYAWDVNNDGFYQDAYGLSPEVIFPDDGSFVIGLKVTDRTGLSDTDAAELGVLNLPAAVNAGPDRLTQEGVLFSLQDFDVSVTFSDPGVLDAHTAAIDWGDGISEPGTVGELNGAGRVNGTHTYLEDGSYTVEICVTDDDGATGCDIFEVSVNNVAPRVEFVDLHRWTAESYPAVHGFPDGEWTVAEDGQSVFQSKNGQPTLFYSDFNVFNTEASVKISTTGIDDDFIGFALGFEPGDTSSHQAEYYLIDWKRQTQTSLGFGPPSCSGRGTAYRGLAISRVFGIPDADEFWKHNNADAPCTDLNNGLEELARAASLGSTGWVLGREYEFEFEVRPDHLLVYVDGRLEFDLDGNFANGRLAFYNFSQANVTYSAFALAALGSAEGSLLDLTGRFFDPGVLDTHTGTLEWGDDSPLESGMIKEAGGSGTISGSHVYLEDGSYMVEGCVTDDEGATGCNNIRINVANLAPVVMAGPDLAVNPGDSISLAPATFTDAGILDTHTARVDWGEGVSEPAAVEETDGAGTVSAAHVYDTLGIFTAEVCVTDDEGGTGCDSFEVLVEAGAPDLTITKEDGLTSALPGQVLTYTLSVSNVGDQQATGVVITDTLPIYTTFSEASDGGVETGGVVTWPAFALADGASLSRTVTVQVADILPSGVNTITNTASASDDGANGPDPTPANNTAEDVDLVEAAPDLLVTKDDGGVSAAPGEAIIYTLVYRNAGNQGATGVVINEMVPENTTFNAPLSAFGWSCTDGSPAGTPCTFAIGDLEAGEGATLDFAVAVDNPLSDGVTEITNTAAIADDGGNGVDLNPGDNRDTDTTPVNSPPVAVDDAYDTDEDTALNVAAPGVLGNDSDVDGDPLTAVLEAAPRNGALTFNANGSFEYTPESGFCGEDNFTYHANDGRLDSNLATVTLTVNCVNDPPVAEDDTYSVDEDTALVIAAPGVLGNDSDVDGDALSVDSSTQPGHGTLALQADGSFTYTPDEDFCGADNFTYTASDGNNGFDTATVTIEVACVNDPPEVSLAPEFQTVQYSDGIAPVTISATDRDSPAEAIEATAPDLPAGLVLSAKTCTPAENGINCDWTISGPVGEPAGFYEIEIIVSDGAGGTGTATTTIQVAEENATVIFEDTYVVKVPVPGGDSGEFSLTVNIQESMPDNGNDPFPGDIGYAGASMRLEPIGPDGGVEGVCTPGEVGGSGYDSLLPVACSFNDVPVNGYVILVSVEGGYYTGSGEDLLMVYDPGGGFTTGGSWFYWPDSEDPGSGYPGDLTNFGFTAKYLRGDTRLQGNLQVTRRLPNGTLYRLKSYEMEVLAAGEGIDPDSGEGFGWAIFRGKGAYREPGWPRPKDGYEFLVYVEDRDEPGTGTDRFWLQVRDEEGYIVSALSLTWPPAGQAVEIHGGNIVVPHEVSGTNLPR